MTRYSIVDGVLVEDPEGTLVMLADVAATQSKIATTCLTQLKAVTAYIESFVQE